MVSHYLHHHECFGQQSSEPTRSTLKYLAELVTRERIESLTGAKYFPCCYLERPEVDDAVTRWFLKGETPAFLIAGTAGSGKTSLLCRIADGSLLRNQQVTAHLVRGDEMGKGQRPLLQRLLQDFELEGKSFRTLIEAWDRRTPRIRWSSSLMR